MGRDMESETVVGRGLMRRRAQLWRGLARASRERHNGAA
jgi:hypothetical protein